MKINELVDKLNNIEYKDLFSAKIFELKNFAKENNLSFCFGIVDRNKKVKNSIPLISFKGCFHDEIPYSESIILDLKNKDFLEETSADGQEALLEVAYNRKLKFSFSISSLITSEFNILENGKVASKGLIFEVPVNE